MNTIHEPGCPAIADDDDAGRCVCYGSGASATEIAWAQFRLLHPELYPERAKWQRWPYANETQVVS